MAFQSVTSISTSAFTARLRSLLDETPRIGLTICAWGLHGQPLTYFPAAKAVRKVREATVLCTRLDRLARSTRDLLQIAETLENKGVNLRVLDQPIDTSTASGKLFFTILGAFGEFEADIRKERQREGIDAALAKGDASPFKGRPATIEAKKVATLRAEGHTPTQIAAKLGIARSSVYRYLGEAEAR